LTRACDQRRAGTFSCPRELVPSLVSTSVRSRPASLDRAMTTRSRTHGVSPTCEPRARDDGPRAPLRLGPTADFRRHDGSWNLDPDTERARPGTGTRQRSARARCSTSRTGSKFSGVREFVEPVEPYRRVRRPLTERGVPVRAERLARSILADCDAGSRRDGMARAWSATVPEFFARKARDRNPSRPPASYTARQ